MGLFEKACKTLLNESDGNSIIEKVISGMKKLGFKPDKVEINKNDVKEGLIQKVSFFFGNDPLEDDSNIINLLKDIGFKQLKKQHHYKGFWLEPVHAEISGNNHMSVTEINKNNFAWNLIKNQNRAYPN
jgi:hypothetical protein